MNDLKQQYNKLLKRYKDAEAYIDDKQRSQQELDKWLPEFCKIVRELNFILAKIGPHEPDEAVNGFKEDNA